MIDSHLDNYHRPWFKNYLQMLCPSPGMGPWNESAARNLRRYVMGSYLNLPNVDKFNEHGRGNGLRYGVSCMQGWRTEMEDTHSAVVSLGQDRGIWKNASLVNWSYFGVFDGRAGDTASSYCADQLLGAIIYSPEFQEDIVKGIKAGFTRLDNRLRRLPDTGSGKDKASSTAVVVFISPFNIYVAHCGDSRAVLTSEGRLTFETIDHNPSNVPERERVEKAGGTITLIQELSGLMTVTRSFGDFRYKDIDKSPEDHIVIVEPDVEIIRRDRKDNFLVLACNGVWDVMSSQEVSEFVRHMMLLSDDLEHIASCLVSACLYKGSRDSATALIVAFGGASRPDEQWIRRDRRIDRFIEGKVKEILTGSKYSSLRRVVDKLGRYEIPYLPPGGGLLSKMHIIESVFNEVRPEQAGTALTASLHPSNRFVIQEAILF